MIDMSVRRAATEVVATHVRALAAEQILISGRPYHPNDSWGLEGSLNHSRTGDLSGRVY